MSGVNVITITVIIGSITGLLFKKGMPKKITDAIMIGIGLCTVSIGISGLVSDVNTIILIISIVLGAIVGTALDIDAKINHMGDFLSKKFKSNDDKASVSEGFVTACLLFCIGSMTIVGSLNAGISGDNKLLYTKALLDLVSSTVLANKAASVNKTNLPFLISTGFKREIYVSYATELIVFSSSGNAVCHKIS